MARAVPVHAGRDHRGAPARAPTRWWAGRADIVHQPAEPRRCTTRPGGAVPALVGVLPPDRRRRPATDGAARAERQLAGCLLSVLCRYSGMLPCAPRPAGAAASASARRRRVCAGLITSSTTPIATARSTPPAI